MNTSTITQLTTKTTGNPQTDAMLIASHIVYGNLTYIDCEGETVTLTGSELESYDIPTKVAAFAHYLTITPLTSTDAKIYWPAIKKQFGTNTPTDSEKYLDLYAQWIETTRVDYVCDEGDYWGYRHECDDYVESHHIMDALAENGIIYPLIEGFMHTCGEPGVD